MGSCRLTRTATLEGRSRGSAPRCLLVDLAAAGGAAEFVAFGVEAGEAQLAFDVVGQAGGATPPRSLTNSTIGSPKFIENR